MSNESAAAGETKAQSIRLINQPIFREIKRYETSFNTFETYRAIFMKLGIEQLNIIDHRGWTPLIYLIEYFPRDKNDHENHLNMIKGLLSAGANPNLRTRIRYGDTCPFFSACRVITHGSRKNGHPNTKLLRLIKKFGGNMQDDANTSSLLRGFLENPKHSMIKPGYLEPNFIDQLILMLKHKAYDKGVVDYLFEHDFPRIKKYEINRLVRIVFDFQQIPITMPIQRLEHFKKRWIFVDRIVWVTVNDKSADAKYSLQELIRQRVNVNVTILSARKVKNKYRRISLLGERSVYSLVPMVIARNKKILNLADGRGIDVEDFTTIEDIRFYRVLDAEENRARKKRKAEENRARIKREAEENRARIKRKAEENRARNKRKAEESEQASNKRPRPNQLHVQIQSLRF